MKAMAHFFSAALAVAIILSWGAETHWVLDLLSHMQVQFAVASFLLLLFFIARKQFRIALLPASTLAYATANLLPLFIPMTQPTYTGSQHQVVGANLLKENHNFDIFVKYISEANPDVFLALEFTQHWQEGLRSLHKNYPFRIEQPREDSFGIALFSRIPIAESSVPISTASALPMIVAKLSAAEGDFTLIGVHPPPPIGGQYSRSRNSQLAEITELVSSIEGPKIVLGDFNITPWSPYFEKLLKETNLKNASRGFGIQPTWPSAPKLFQIPIDHILVSKDVEVIKRDLGPNIGSDHLPVRMEFRTQSKK